MIILITGGCGFVGSNLAVLIKQKNPSFRVIAFDNLRRRGSELSIFRLRENNVEFIHGDIRNIEDFDEIGEITVLIDAAAEPSVTAGINSSIDYMIHTNLNGTINCVNYALKYKAQFIFLSTSRVYPIKHLEQINFIEKDTRFELAPKQTIAGFSIKGVSESFPLNGSRSLYGATKLSSELIIQEYTEFLGLKSVINRCGVVTGAHQMGKVDQGVVVLWVARHFWEKGLSYIGYGGQGKQVRDILHIQDLFRLIDWQMHHKDQVNNEIFNVGGGNECSISLKELTYLCEKSTGNKIKIEKIPENRVADIPIYLTDNTYVTYKTGWVPRIKPQEIVNEITEWIKQNEQILKPILY